MKTTAKRILVIDDDERIQDVIQTCLELLQGWQVTTASSGREGLVRAAAEQPDAILLDVSMPDMDGLTTAMKLQDGMTTQSIPVVLLTAVAEPTEYAPNAKGAIAGVITKPFDPMALAEQMASLLGWEL